MGLRLLRGGRGGLGLPAHAGLWRAPVAKGDRGALAGGRVPPRGQDAARRRPDWRRHGRRCLRARCERALPADANARLERRGDRTAQAGAALAPAPARSARPSFVSKKWIREVSTQSSDSLPCFTLDSGSSRATTVSEPPPGTSAAPES